jgi:hypothetical protein
MMRARLRVLPDVCMSAFVCACIPHVASESGDDARTFAGLAIVLPVGSTWTIALLALLLSALGIVRLRTRSRPL